MTRSADVFSAAAISAIQSERFPQSPMKRPGVIRTKQRPTLRRTPSGNLSAQDRQYEGKEADLSKIASELGVDSVMTGRFTKRGDNLDITVELVDARNNKSLWGEHKRHLISIQVLLCRASGSAWL